MASGGRRKKTGDFLPGKGMDGEAPFWLKACFFWGFCCLWAQIKASMIFIIKHHQGRLKKHVKHQSSSINWNFYQSYQTSSTSSIIHWKSMQLLWYQLGFFSWSFPNTFAGVESFTPASQSSKDCGNGHGTQGIPGYLEKRETAQNSTSNKKKYPLLTLPAQQESYQLKKVLDTYYIDI